MSRYTEHQRVRAGHMTTASVAGTKGRIGGLKCKGNSRTGVTVEGESPVAIGGVNPSALTNSPRSAFAKPRRIQRRRTKGWRMPEGAVYVGRPSKWGNELLPTMPDVYGRQLGVDRTVELYRLATLRFVEDGPAESVAAFLAPLRGHDLVCWCPLDQACHADVLLELANR